MAGGIPLTELARHAGAQLIGDGDVLISRVATLQSAERGSIVFLSHPRYRSQLAGTRASAVILTADDAEATSLPRLVTVNPYAVYARVAVLLHPPTVPLPGADPTAVIAASARIAATATVGAHAIVGERTTLGEGAWLHSGAVIGDDCSIGAGTIIYPNVTIYSRCQIGARTIIHGGAVIGADGFGMAEHAGRWIKIPQIGRVVIGNDVEIGANTTIDRGALDDTVIEDDVKLDNQIQIGHNCRIGAHSAIAGCVGIAGSTRIGKNCKIGGASMINGHIEIADGTIISAGASIHSTIREPGIYSSVIPAVPNVKWKRLVIALLRLPSLVARVRAIERKIGLDHPPESEIAPGEEEER